jgi:hypothetical protein
MDNEELLRRKAIYLEGEFIPLSEVTWEQMCNPRAVFPFGYDFEWLPLETQGAAMLAPLELKRALNL